MQAVYENSDLPISAAAHNLGRMSKSQRKPLSETDRAAAARLKQIWGEKAVKLGLTQAVAAQKCGWTQSTVSHYMNGYTPLNTDAVLKFARLLEVKPDEIRPDIAPEIAEIASSAVDRDRGERKYLTYCNLQELRLLSAYRGADGAGQKSIIASAEAIADQSPMDQKTFHFRRSTDALANG